MPVTDVNVVGEIVSTEDVVFESVVADLEPGACLIRCG